MHRWHEVPRPCCISVEYRGERVASAGQARRSTDGVLAIPRKSDGLLHGTSRKSDRPLPRDKDGVLSNPISGEKRDHAGQADVRSRLCPVAGLLSVCRSTGTADRGVAVQDRWVSCQDGNCGLSAVLRLTGSPLAAHRLNAPTCH